jgi:hypothetical protein
VAIVSIWVQKKIASANLMSSALFCLWLSTASLVPVIELVVWSLDRPTHIQAEAGAPQKARRATILTESP